MGKFFPLMRTGTFTDRHGVKYGITKDVLKKIAATFNPSNPPRITIGHPDRERVPVFGVIDALKVVGDKLLGKPAKLCAEFAALVRSGGFPSVSAGLSRDLSRLDHVAFLSAQNPAISGLVPIAEFSALAGDDVSAIDITESVGELAEFATAPGWWISSRMKEVGSLLRGLKNYIIEKEGAEEADKLLPEYAFDMLADDPPVEEPTEDAAASADFNQPPEGAEDVKAEFDVGPAAAGQAEPDYKTLYEGLLPKHDAAEKAVAEFSAAISTLESEKAALAARVAELEKASRLAEFSAWVEERIAEGKVKPCEKQEIIDRMESICEKMPGAEFSTYPDSGGPNILDIVKKDIMARPRVAPATGATPAPQFAAHEANTDVKTVSKLARAYMTEQEAKGITVSATDAVHHVMRNFNL